MPAASKCPTPAVLQDLIDKGMSHRTIGEHLGVHKSTARDWLRQHSMRTLSTGSVHYGGADAYARREMIRAMYADGASLYKIHTTVKCRYKTIHAAIADMPAPEAKPIQIVSLPRTGPSAFALWCANPFGQAVNDVAECV